LAPPTAYIVNASDLGPAHRSNELEKFADNTYLLVAAAQASLRQLEIDNVETWASNNNLQLNRAKSQEIMFRKTGKKLDLALLPSPLPGFTRVTSIKILRVTIANNFSVSAHVDSIIASCAQTLYALKILRAHGMSDSIKIRGGGYTHLCSSSLVRILQLS